MPVQDLQKIISQLSRSSAGLEKLRQAEFLLQENEGQADAEIALLLAEAESQMLQTPHPDQEILQLLAELRLEAAREIPVI